MPPLHASPRDRITALFAHALSDAPPSQAGGSDAADHNRIEAGVSAAERLYDGASGALARWFGAYGTHALVTRALLRTQIDHPALRSLTLGPVTDVDVAPPLRLLGIAEGARAHGDAAMVSAILALLTSLAELVSRLIGENVAMTIIERGIGGPVAATPAASGLAAPSVPRTSPTPPSAPAFTTPDADPELPTTGTEP